jgi:heme-degrading monooxygenase HmoA
MAIKVLIQRKIKPGKEKELSKAVKELRSIAIHAPGYISGETLRSIEDPTLHLVISTWKSIEDWNRWMNCSERESFERKIGLILEEPTRVTPFEHELYPVAFDEALSSLEFGVEGE